ncbi:GNAT family N-acetyltransferase [Alkalicoccobacillus gibsonii]|jgi:ribosomal protein S18 acetylase RimI-like enzyme|uniref:GNAT family N-acetyltransferase n=1 Tax=Alkalicoccobacillus gibsonii TaxID=79881 RepID=UPI00193330FE|nr:GNAT family N-acetyltransferase [Alkalicoccobacillus gibsonii]MBM0065048.1 GNAT family N-acetyltransferase [Alkalicoccobacillus gibsonii]
MQLSYYVNASVTAQEVADVFESSGIKRPISDLARIQQMIDAAPLLISVRDDKKLVGIARSLTDFCYCCYLSDLAVRKEYQSAGIGRELIEQTKKEIGDSCSLVLLSAPNAMDYYPRVGLTPAHHAFYNPRKK